MSKITLLNNRHVNAIDTSFTVSKSGFYCKRKMPHTINKIQASSHLWIFILFHLLRCLDIMRVRMFSVRNGAQNLWMICILQFFAMLERFSPPNVERKRHVTVENTPLCVLVETWRPIIVFRSFWKVRDQDCVMLGKRKKVEDVVMTWRRMLKRRCFLRKLFSVK